MRFCYLNYFSRFHTSTAWLKSQPGLKWHHVIDPLVYNELTQKVRYWHCSRTKPFASLYASIPIEQIVFRRRSS